jgi:SOS-response transcriptional repressor LexA
MNIPTRKQKELLDFIDNFTDDHDVSPTYREIADALGLSSVASVAQRIDNCVDSGFLEKHPREARSLRVISNDDNSDIARLFRQKIAALNAREAADGEDPSISEADLSLTKKSVNEQITTLKKAAKILGIRL